MILEILLVVTLFLWLLTLLPHPSLASYAGTHPYLAFIACVLITLVLFAPGLR